MRLLLRASLRDLRSPELRSQPELQLLHKLQRRHTTRPG
jgi:hypothetical protein